MLLHTSFFASLLTNPFFAQETSDYEAHAGGGMGGVIGGVIGLLVAVIMIAAMWKVYAKAGQPGWACLIPIYNMYVWCKIVGRPGWWVILLFIPFVNFIMLIMNGLSGHRNKSQRNLILNTSSTINIMR